MMTDRQRWPSERRRIACVFEGGGEERAGLCCFTCALSPPTHGFLFSVLFSMLCTDSLGRSVSHTRARSPLCSMVHSPGAIPGAGQRMALRLECRYAVTLLLLSLPLPLPLPVSPRPQTPVPGSSPCHPLVFRPSCPALSIHQFLGERFCPFLVCALALRSRSPPALSFSLLCSVDSALGLSRWLSRSVGRSIVCFFFARSLRFYIWTGGQQGWHCDWGEDVR